MLPDNTLSTTPVLSLFQRPRDIPKRPLIDYEYGGIAIQDPSEGLLRRIWRGRYIGEDVVLDAVGVAPVTVITVPDITEFQFTFDQNMQVFVTYVVAAADAFYYYFNDTAENFITEQLPPGSITPRCSLDDKRAVAGQGVSDIILAYVRAGSLYYRQQRDRYEIERELYDGAGPGGLIQVGMARNLRFQFQLATG